MFLIIDLLRFDNHLAEYLGIKEKVAFVHNLNYVNVTSDNVRYIRISDLQNAALNPDIVIINRGTFAARMGQHNILTIMSSLYPNAKIIIFLGEGDSVPNDVPINIPFKIFSFSDMDISDFFYRQLGMGVDVVKVKSTNEDIAVALNSLEQPQSIQNSISDIRKVLILKKTILANAPDELVKAINTYSKKYQATLSFVPKEGFDLIHHNNIYQPMKHPRQLIQYHSEPIRVTLPNTPIPNSMGTRVPEKRLVLAQYHAALKEYEGMIHVRNVINFEGNSQYNINYRLNHKLRVGYSPSTLTKVNQYYDKGYEETKKILESIEGIEYDIINGVSLDECLKRKSQCDIIIDECVTGSYHRSGLEGLALGKMTICWLNEGTEKVLKDFVSRYTSSKEEVERSETSDTRLIPFENVKITDLSEFLKRCVAMPREEIAAKGVMNRRWMERYWHPKLIVQEFEKIYDEMF